MSRFHALERTSPKGEGQHFVGTCVKCGRLGLLMSAAHEECDNAAGLTDREELEIILTGALSSAGESD